MMTEDQEQEALFEWASLQAAKYPELDMLYAVPNGGWRHIRTAALLKRTGVKPGVPDMCLPVARGKYHGLYIELKRRKGGVVSLAQRCWLNVLQGQGYRAEACAGWEAAAEVILAYLKEATP